MRRGLRTLLVQALFLASHPVLAVRTVIWTQSPAELLRGQADAVSFTGRGAIVLSPRIEDLSQKDRGAKGTSQGAISEPIVWCEALDGEGNLLLGTGHSGRIVRVTPRGEVGTLAQLSEPEVTALVVGAGGAIYAGTSPNGAIYRIGKDGEPKVLYEEMNERYVWALLEDGAGNLYAGTGERGKVFRISPKGEGTLLYDSPEPHITSMALERGGTLLAGTSGSGLIYRIEPDKGASVLYDSQLAEIADLSIDGAGQIYAAAISSGVGEAPAPAFRLRVRPAEEEAAVAPPAEEISPRKPRETGRERPRGPMEAEIEGLGPPEASSAQAREGGGAVLRIAPDGSVEEVWRSAEEVPYAVVATTDGIVYLGTGEPAKLLRLEEAGRPVLVARLPQAQLTRLVHDRAGRVFAATSNSGGAYRLSPEISESGTYVSPPRDAGVRARWGRVRWDASLGNGQKIEVQTRSGNSMLPDETWSSWSPVYADPDGSEIVSAPGRYIQWRARLVRSSQGSSSPVLRSVSISFLPRNRPPRIQEVKLLTTEESRAGASRSPAAGSATDPVEKPAPEGPAKGSAARTRTLVWHADDPDEDTLVYHLYLQKEGDERSSPLASDLSDSTFSFDESTWPEGRYRVKVVTSDAPANVPGEALEAEALSEFSVIDHSPPLLELLPPRRAGGPPVVRASDSLSAILSAEILTGDKVISVARPIDGVLDSRQEILEIDLPPLVPLTPPGGLRLRVRDSAGNESVLDLAPPAGASR